MSCLGILLLVVVQGTLGSKILMIPVVATSHCLEMISIGRELLARGHEVTLLSLMVQVDKCASRIKPDSLREKLRVISVQVDSEHLEKEKEFDRQSPEIVFGNKPLISFLFTGMKPRLRNVCEAALSDSSLWGKLEKEKFDLVMVDGLIFTACVSAIAVPLDIPMVSVSAYIDPNDCRMPFQANTMPNFLFSFSNEMNFLQRLINAVSIMLTPLFGYMIRGSFDLSRFHSKLQDVSVHTLLQRPVLFLENSDFLIDYPKAVFPNFVQVGGLTAGPADPLTGDLKSYMDSAQGGVTLVTFGSMLKDCPPHLKDKLMSVFRGLQTKVLFNIGKDSVEGNVRTTKWLPQNDVLAHPNTKVFVSHCGKNGFWEALYHGVPIICMPLHAETFTTARKVKNHQIGASIDIFDNSVEDMIEIITDVIQNSSYSKNMKRMSGLFKDRPEPAAARGASAIEHVLKHGYAHLQPPSDFGSLSFYYADVWFVIFGVCVLVLWFDVWLCRKCCCRGKFKGKEKRE